MVENSSPVLVSVVIPVYQASELRAALDSVFAQTFSDYEVVVINDGSPETQDLERTVASYGGRVHYFKQENRGPSGARNAGIRQARGKYVALLDSDDFWFPKHLEKQVALLREDATLGLVYSDRILIEDGESIGNAFRFMPQTSPVTFEALLKEECVIATSSVVASREAMVDAGLFDEGLTRCEDFDLWARMAFRGTSMAFSRAAEVCHRRFNGLSSQQLVMKCSAIAVFQKLAADLPLSAEQQRVLENKVRAMKAEYHMQSLKESLRSGDYKDALVSAREAGRLRNDWKIRFAIAGLRTVPGLVRQSYRAYEQALKLRRRKRVEKHSKVAAPQGLSAEIKSA